MFIAALFTKPRHVTNLNVINRWLNKGVVSVCVCIYMCTHIENYQPLKRMRECSNMGGPRYCHTKWSKSGREGLTPYDIIHVKSKIWHKLVCLWNRSILTDIENRVVVAKGQGSEGGKYWEFGISRCKLLHIEWIDEVLLYSTGNIFNILW